MRGLKAYGFVVLFVLVGLVAVVPAAAGPGVRNDTYDKATVIRRLDYTKSVRNELATNTGDPSATCTTVVQGVWFKYTPTGTTTLIADTLGSWAENSNAYDTALAVFTLDGTTWTQVTCNDDIDLGGGNLLSRVQFDPTAGTTYYFLVGTCCNGPYEDPYTPHLRFNLSAAA